jgi:AcrR family transcriptional regulator
MQTAEDIKQQIVEVANKHFVQYGFGKTTMAEIAKDCDMSPANLYRYFDNKEAIGAEIALNCMRHKEHLGREALKEPGLTAGARLERFILDVLRYTYDLMSNQAHISELVDHISQERDDLVRRHKEVLRAIVAEILAEGNRTGEFDVSDIITTADQVLVATIHYYYPPLVMIERLPLEDLEASLKGVVSLIVRGLAKR